jgi:hypothetical protein
VNGRAGCVGRDVNRADGCSIAGARVSGVALGRVLGVHGLHRRDILQLDWCGPCRLYAVGCARRWVGFEGVGPAMGAG